MDTVKLERLTKVIQGRMEIQHAQDKDDPEQTKYTEAEHIGFALEEANLNGELDFLSNAESNLEAIKDCAECHYQPCRKHDN